MQPAAFPGATGILGPPPGATEDTVSSLYIHRSGGTVISCWKPTAEELAEIQRTGRVWLHIWGPSMPPACVMGHSPFEAQP
ncbi:unnamed protein product [Scytosiphon promiscuus]